jgi:hypothetical protein
LIDAQIAERELKRQPTLRSGISGSNGRNPIALAEVLGAVSPGGYQLSAGDAMNDFREG